MTKKVGGSRSSGWLPELWEPVKTPLRRRLTDRQLQVLSAVHDGWGVDQFDVVTLVEEDETGKYGPEGEYIFQAIVAENEDITPGRGKTSKEARADYAQTIVDGLRWKLQMYAKLAGPKPRAG